MKKATILRAAAGSKVDVPVKKALTRVKACPHSKGYTEPWAVESWAKFGILLTPEAQFDRRMSNWRLTVTAGEKDGAVCAAWARAYIAHRDKAQMDLARQAGIPVPVAPVGVCLDVLDGWLVEAVVSSMENQAERNVLRMLYVWQLPHDVIRNRINLRGPRFAQLVHAAKTHLQELLTSAAVIN